MNKALIFSALLSLIIITFASIAVGIRSYYREPVSDDLLYRYCLDSNPLGENDYSVEVKTLSDAFESQAKQYFYSNGRLLIHVLVQMFAGPWGFTAYSIFLGIMMFVTLILFSRYTLSYQKRINPLFTTLIVVSFLYLFQHNSSSWYSIAGGMNYLFPIILVLMFLLIVDKIREHKSSLWFYPLIILFGFLVGWSQECYSLPLSGGLFIYMIMNLKKNNSGMWALAISLWIGTAILVLAPGNFVRLGQQAGLFKSAYKGILFLVGTKLFWLLLIGLIILRIKSKGLFQDFIKNNILGILILGIAILFGMVANTLPQSFNGISFYCSILLFRLINIIPIPRTSISVCGCLLLCIPMFIHQCRIIDKLHEIRDINHEFVQTYITSPDGIVPIPEISISEDIKPFVNNWFTSPVRWWLMHTLEQHYFKGLKPIILLNESDYLNCCGNNGLVQKEIIQGEDYIGLDNSSVEKGDTILIDFEQ